MLKTKIQILKQYGTSVGWIFLDLLQYFWPQWLLASLVMILAPAFQALAFILLSYFVSSITQGNTIYLKQFQLNFLNSNDTSTILSIAVICTVLLVLAAIARFFGEKLFIKLRISYTYFNITRGLRIISKFWGGYPKESSEFYKNLISFLRRDAIHCGRIALLAASMGAPLVELIVSTIAALWLYPLLTIVISGITLFAVRFLHRFSVVGNYHSSRRESAAREASQELKTYITKNEDFKDITIKKEKEAFADFFLPKTDQWLSSVFQYLLTVPLSRLVTGVLSGLVIGAVVVGLGVYINTDTIQVSRSLIYLIALRYMVKSFQQIISSLSSLNRFYSQASRYRNLLKGKLPPDLFTSQSLDNKEDLDS